MDSAALSPSKTPLPRPVGAVGRPTVDLDRLARVFAALADPTRLRIVDLLAGRELAGNEVAEALGISRALACHHLTKLVEAGLVRQRREGQSKYNALNHALLERQLGQLVRTASG